MTVRLLSALVGVFADRFRTTTGDATRPVLPGAMWSPHLGRIPGWSASQARTPVISQRFAASRDQVRQARNFVAELLGDGHPLLDDALLLTSELATNAVEHSDSRTETYGPHLGELDDRLREFVVTVAFTAHGVLVTVQDSGASGVPCTRDSGPAATGGRGLVLVNEIATRWGFHRDSIGTVIWFELGSSGAEAERPGAPVRWTGPYDRD
ncbi:ATP-binding protein [Streptosporangium sp. NPDC050855]|uniref:ATP-binding protein n=1 Tax=Streptosporangium sp. NPDC050855 TaxID=3366194 RepID=UPI003795DFE2